VSSKKNKIDKGLRVEEILRTYFLEMGLYVVRGAKLQHGDTSITDIDLWLYSRPTPFTRERINVDIKYKSTPQAMERILWTKGLQTMLGLESCIVATTNKQPQVQEFGKKYGVAVLDGTFLDSLIKKYKNKQNRYYEEEIYDIKRDDKKLKEWQTKIDKSKTLLVTSLDYNACNLWLYEIKFFLDQIMVSGVEKEFACRSFYLLLSFFLIGIDYLLHSQVFKNNSNKNSYLVDRLRFGEKGYDGYKEAIELASKIVFSKAKISPIKIKSDFLAEFKAIPVEMLAEYLLKPEVAKSLFTYAKRLESLAFNKSFVSPDETDSEIKSIIGLLLDYSGIDRRKLFSSLSSDGQKELKLDSK